MGVPVSAEGKMAALILGVGTTAVSHCPVATERLKISCLAVPMSAQSKLQPHAVQMECVRKK
jgi:hypothetical protein